MQEATQQCIKEVHVTYTPQNSFICYISIAHEIYSASTSLRETNYEGCGTSSSDNRYRCLRVGVEMEACAQDENAAPSILSCICI